MHIVRLACKFKYESAHFLPNVPPGHKCGVLHGHSYVLTVYVEGPVGNDGFVVDFAEVKSAVAPILAELDHHPLNEVQGLDNPTVENQLVWWWDRLDGLPWLRELHLQETETSSASYCGARW